MPHHDMQGGQTLRRIDKLRVRDLFSDLQDDTELEIWEATPQKRTIKIGLDETYYLAFPYIQFVKRGLYLFTSFTNEPIQSLSDRLYFPALPNVYHDGMVCLDLLEEEKMEDLISLFWHAKFSREITWPGWREAGRMFGNRPSPYSHWQTQTEKKELSFITKVPWSERLSLRMFCVNSKTRQKVEAWVRKRMPKLKNNQKNQS